MAIGTISAVSSDGRRKVTQLDAARLRIGTALDNDLVIDGPGVAVYHAVIECDDQVCRVTDIGSSDGTRIDGMPMLRHTAEELEPGSVIQIGEWKLDYSTANGADHSAAPGPRVTQPLRLTNDEFLLEALFQPLKPAPVAPPPPTNGHSATDDLLASLLAQNGPRRAAAPTSPAAAIDTAPMPVDSASPLQVMLNDYHIRLAPGYSEKLNITITNRGSGPDNVDLAIEGVPEGGYQFLTPRIELQPGASAVAQLELRAPAGHVARAGTYPFQVIARSEQGPRAIAQAMLEIAPTYDFKLALKPQRRGAALGALYQLTISNDSNTDLQLSLQGRDDQNGLRFRFVRPQVVAPAGVDLVVPFRAKLRLSQVIGQDKPYPFTITATPGFDLNQAKSVNGELRRQPALPPVVMALIAFMLIASFALAAFALASSFVCDRAADGLPLTQAVLARLYPFCRNTAIATNPTVVPAIAEIFGTSEARAQRTAMADAGQAALVAAVQQTQSVLSTAAANDQNQLIVRTS
jgi:hypothetical protein